MGALADDILPGKKKPGDPWRRLPNGEPSGGAAWEASMAEASAAKAADEEYDKAGQAAKDLKTKRASEGKIRY